MINPQHKLSVRQQCMYLDLHRSYVQYGPVCHGDDTTLANLIGDLYHPNSGLEWQI